VACRSARRRGPVPGRPGPTYPVLLTLPCTSWPRATRPAPYREGPGQEVNGPGVERRRRAASRSVGWSQGRSVEASRLKSPYGSGFRPGRRVAHTRGRDRNLAASNPHRPISAHSGPGAPLRGTRGRLKVRALAQTGIPPPGWPVARADRRREKSNSAYPVAPHGRKKSKSTYPAANP
jgi:hypothetical protein